MVDRKTNKESVLREELEEVLIILRKLPEKDLQTILKLMNLIINSKEE